MRICDILAEDMVLADTTAATKEAVLEQLAGMLGEHPDVDVSASQIFTCLVNRERLGSTGVGEGVAIPHAKISGLTQLTACFARAPQGIPFEAIDKKPANLIFVLLVPENSAGAHLKALARVSRLLKSSDFRGTLLAADDVDGLYGAFVAEDDKQH